MGDYKASLKSLIIKIEKLRKQSNDTAYNTRYLKNSFSNKSCYIYNIHTYTQILNDKNNIILTKNTYNKKYKHVIELS